MRAREAMDGSYIGCRLALLLLLTLSNILALEITRLSIPNFVQNGSEESVLLDCEYKYNLEKDSKLVLKWFHEDDPKPVYQWIPEMDSFIVQSEKFRINMDYVVPSGDRYTRSRALNMLRPTTELSGRYSCQVESLEGSDSKADSMIVYALPTSVNLNYTTADGLVIIFCEVEGVYPLPEMTLFQIGPGEVDPTPLEELDLDYDLEEGAYHLILSTNISQRQLATDGLRFFGCTVVMNGTEYEKVIQVPYFPTELPDEEDDGPNGSSPLVDSSSFLFVALLSILCCFT